MRRFLPVLLLLSGCVVSPSTAGVPGGPAGPGAAAVLVPLPLSVLGMTARAAGEAGTTYGVSLKWPAIDGATRYEVVRSVGGGTGVAIATTSVLTHFDATVSAGQAVSYRVHGVDEKGKIVRTTIDQPVTLLAAEVAAPAGSAPAVDAVLERDSAPTLTWGAVPGATKYHVQVTRVSDGQVAFATATTATSAPFTLLAAAAYPEFQAIFPVAGASAVGKGLVYEWSISAIREAASAGPGAATLIDVNDSPVYRFSVK